MIFGIGTDIIETERLREMAARGSSQLEGVFTPKEIEYCDQKARAWEHYAGRYAAKEAALKALGVGWRDGMAYTDIEVLDDDLGKPRLLVHGKVQELFERCRIQHTSVSLSHSRENAIAVVILET